MTGSLLLAAMGFAQGLWQVPVPRWCYVVVTGCFLTWAFYRTWLKKDAEIATLNERIEELSRRPYTEDLKRITEQVLDHEMTLEGRHVLRHLMIHEPIEVGRAFMPEIPQERQQAQLGIAIQRGLVQQRLEVQAGRNTYWIINPRFRPVLEDVLYQDGRI